ncbi:MULTISPECIES: hypothetical protein [unclassified Streptomyces]|uniref:hypothetical protein n=1 Tax=Streptomyces sp. NPDC055082 TaxID=3365718 RepID=UPI0037D8B017
MTDTMSPPEPTGAAPSPAPRPAPHAARSVLRAELRRGSVPWTGPVVALAVLVPMVNKADEWQGSWGETQGLLHSAATLIAGPLAAAAGCWQGGREHRRRTAGLWLSVPRGRPAQLVMAALPIALWAAVGYLVALAGVSAATWPYTGAGGPSAAVAVTDLCALVSLTFVGFVVGRVCRWRLTAPVLGAAGYVGLGAPSYLSSDARFLNPAQQFELHGTVPVWWFAPVMVVWVGGLALAPVLGYAARRRYLALVPLAVAASVAPLIVGAGEGLFRDDPVAARLVCGDTVPQICVGGLDGPLLPRASEALSGMLSRLEGVPGAPVRYVDPAVRPGADESALPSLTRGWSVVRNEFPDPVDYAAQTVWQLTARDCPASLEQNDPAGARRMWETDDAVAGYLADRDEAFPDPPHPARLTAMPDAERTVWLGRFLASRGSCDPQEVPAL